MERVIIGDKLGKINCGWKAERGKKGKVLDNIFCSCQHFQECGNYVGCKSESKYVNKSIVEVPKGTGIR